MKKKKKNLTNNEEHKNKTYKKHSCPKNLNHTTN